MRSSAAAIEARNAELESALARVTQEHHSLTQQRDALMAELQATHDRATELERERDLLRASHARLREELDLLKKRLFVAKAERVDTAQLELEFAEKLRELEVAAQSLDLHEAKRASGTHDKRKPTGRRDLRKLALPEERIEITDPIFEALVAEGKATRHGVADSARLMRKRGGMQLVVTSRVKYRRFEEEQGKTVVHTTPRPADLLDGTIATASLAAYVIQEKVGKGMPLFRIEDAFAREGVPVDRGTMSRMLEDLGATLGATVVNAMRRDAMLHAFCIATDATGLRVQPERRADKKRQACQRGHFLVLVADRDHVFFDYLEEETSAAIAAAFDGFQGTYVQADAKSVFDILFRPKPAVADDDDPLTSRARWDVGRMRDESSGRPRRRRTSSAEKASCGSDGSSSSTRSGEASLSASDSDYDRSICVLTSKTSCAGARSTSSKRRSVVSFARR